MQDMTPEAQRAYKAAQSEIARVAESGATELNLRGEDYRALDRLPPEIANLTALQTLWLLDTMVSDLTPIANLTALRNLWLDGTAVSDLTPIANLTALRKLSLADTAVSVLNPIAKLTTLQYLGLDGTAVSILTPIANLTALQSLWLNNTAVSDLTSIANLSALQSLWLDGTAVSILTPIANLTALQDLGLNNTAVSDLTPIANLTALQNLLLDGSTVIDLRPITGLKQLGTGKHSIGLTYRTTAATKRDARLAELSQIEDEAQRTRETLAYLRSLPQWPAPYTPAATPDGSPPQPIGALPTPPDQDPALPLIWGENGFSFLANSIQSDPVTAAALDDLRDLLDDLRRKGNQHDDLYRIAGELIDRSAGAIPDLNMVKLHLSYQKLRRLYDGRSARENKFDDETVSVIEAILDVLPGVTLADDGVGILIKRQEAERAAGLSAAQDAAAHKVLTDVQAEDAPFTDEVKDIAAQALLSGADDRLTATRGILSRNVVVAALKFVGKAAIGGAIGNFVYDNGADLLAYAMTMGDDAFFWAQSVFAKFKVEYELLMGITREVVGAGSIKKPKTPPSP